MGTTTDAYRRKKREKESQKNRRKRGNKIKGWYTPGTQLGGGGTGGSGGTA